MKTTFKLLATLIALTPCAHAEWKIEKHVDEMTDVISYQLISSGEAVRSSLNIQYTPELIIELTPTKCDLTTKKVDYTVRSFFAVDDVIDDSYTAAVRFDKRPAVDWEFSRSTSFRSGFLHEPIRFAREVVNSEKVLIGFQTFAGFRTTLRFDASGLSKACAEVKSKIIGERHAGVKYIKTKRPPSGIYMPRNQTPATK